MVEKIGRGDQQGDRRDEFERYQEQIDFIRSKSKEDREHLMWMAFLWENFLKRIRNRVNTDETQKEIVEGFFGWVLDHMRKPDEALKAQVQGDPEFLYDQMMGYLDGDSKVRGSVMLEGMIKK